MKEIKVFIASSEELKEERSGIAELGNSINIAYKDIKISMVEWEYLDASVGKERKQDEYNEKLLECDMCIVLLWNKLGKYTKEEFNTAIDANRDGKKPQKIYIYSKNSDNKDKELVQFEADILNTYQHFSSSFTTIDSLKSQFLIQFIIYVNKELKETQAVKVEYGKVYIGSDVAINLLEVPFVNRNEGYANLMKAITEKEKLISTTENNSDFSNYLKELKSLKTKLRTLENNLWETAIKISELKNKACSERILLAEKAFNEGKIDKADKLLHDIDKRSVNLSKKIASAQAEATIVVKELLLKAKIRIANTKIIIEKRIKQVTKFYDQALEISQRIKIDKESEINLLEEYGNFLFDYGYYEASLPIRIKRESLIPEDQLSKKGFALINLGLSYGKCKKMQEANDAFNKAIQLAGQCDDRLLTAEANNSLGNWYKDQKNLDQAIECHNKALEIWKKKYGEEHPIIARSYNDIANILYAQGKLSEALDLYKKAIGIVSDNKKEDRQAANTLRSYGIALRDFGKTDEAKENIEKAYQILLERLGYNHKASLDTRMELLGLALQKHDYKVINELFKRQAEEGDSIVQCGLGMNYEFGVGCEQNYSEAIKMYEKAAAQNEATAIYRLGKMYLFGKGLDKNELKAREMIERAANLGNTEALYDLGSFYYQDKKFENAFELFQRAAEQGETKAQHNLGICYFNGLGTKVNIEEGLHWCSVAANNGYDKSYLAILYNLIIKQGKYAEAEPWVEKALKAFPNNADFHRYAGVIYQHKWEFTLAIKHYKEMFSLLNNTPNDSIISEEEKEAVKKDIANLENFLQKYQSSALYRSRWKLSGHPAVK